MRGSRTKHGIGLRVAAGIAASALGLWLLVLSVPLLVADVLAPPVPDALWRTNDAADASQLRSFVARRQVAAEWHGRARHYTDIALARMRLAAELPESRDAEEALAEQALTTGLALSPAGRLVWLRLVQLRLVALGRSPDRMDTAAEIAGPLSIALRYGADPERRLLPLVAMAGLAAWQHLDDDSRQKVASGVGEAWKRDPLATLTGASRIGRTDTLAKLAGL